MAATPRGPQCRSPSRQVVCNTCTVRLVDLAYRRAWWFRWVRKPLTVGMKVLAAWHGIDALDYSVRTPACRGCTRFLKTALKEESAAFRWLNGRVNPVFDRLLETVVTGKEVQEAKRFAREATHDTRKS
ncbi:MAG: nitroreductase [Thermodesulfobacteriota bacterium]